MSLNAIPVTSSDLIDLQHALQSVTNTAEANAQTTLINNGGNTVFQYGANMLDNNISITQVAMADWAVMTGKTPTQAQLDNVEQNFLPGQVHTANVNGYNPTVYAAEALGLGLASNPDFQSHMGVPGPSGEFTQANKIVFEAILSNATGVNSGAIDNFLTNWINFYSANPGTHNGLTVSQAAAGATAGDAIGIALLNPTSANLFTHHEDGHEHGLVANALFDLANGQYTVGVALTALPNHTPFQGEIAGPV